eukprot:m.476029 g.476029  ORF g.476029 m.476029 type:complete len:392 (-) comp20409_c0_seq1:653-1828(-)
MCAHAIHCVVFVARPRHLLFHNSLKLFGTRTNDVSFYSSPHHHQTPTTQLNPPTMTEVKYEDLQGDGSLNSDFEQIPINIFPTPALGKLVVINSDTSLIEAVETLSKYNILAAPLRDVSQPDDAGWTDKYLGLFDMSKAVLAMLDVLKPGGKEPTDLLEEARACVALQKMTAGDLAKTNKLDPFVPVDQDSGTLLDPMLLCGIHGVRRVPVVKTPGGDMVNIITQSALIQTVSENLDRFVAVADTTIKANNLGTAAPKVFSVTTDDPLAKAFELIRKHDVSAVPVVDETGAIKGNVSARDVRLVIPSSKVYKLLHLPVRNYLDVVTQKDNSAICCTPDNTLGEVILKMVVSRIHRVYVVDEDQKPIRVLSMSNVLARFVKEPEGYFHDYFG